MTKSYKPIQRPIRIGDIDLDSDDPSASLQLDDTDRGFLVNRLSTAQRDAINGPATGLMIWNTDLNGFQAFDGLVWISFVNYSFPNLQLQTNHTVTYAENLTRYCNARTLADITLSLPFSSVGLEYTIFVTDHYFITFQAAGNDTIRVGDSISIAGGIVTSNQIGATLTIYCPVRGQWIAKSATGIWTIT